MLGADNDLLESCFWKRSAFQEYGLYVLRFFKDCSVMYVIVDDRLPVKAKDGRLIFAANKDPNELWVPLIEKAYAKLHGCYKSLIGGYTHYGLADMTGFCPRLVVMREGYLGFSEPYTPDDVWSLLQRYFEWDSLMGCSIQSNPKEKNKVEADAGQGLHFGHAYSLLGIGEITVDKKDSKSGTMKLVKLRNPWGRGEWEGRFGDRSDEREKYDSDIEKAFNATVRDVEKLTQNFNDGTFIMPFDDWLKYYTSLFVAINFPKTWCGKRTQGVFSSEQGGNREMGTWITNPKFKLRLERDATKPAVEDEYKQVFVGIYIKDSRLTLGFDYYKDPLYATPITFDIVTEKELQDPNPKIREFVPAGYRYENKQGNVKQPPYNFGTTQVEVFLKVGIDYYIVPSLYKRHQAGTFFLNVYADTPSFFLDGSTVVSEAQRPMIVGSGASAEPLKMSVSQYYERKEALRERIVSEAQRLNLSLSQLQAIFKDCKDKMSRSAFKRRMMEVGFMLTDFPDDDLVVLDKDNDGSISPQEFIEFYQEGLKFTDVTIAGPVPEKPVDDLLLKSIDLSGELHVKVIGARGVREGTSWFSSALNAQTPTDSVVSKTGSIIRYDPVEAKALRLKAFKERSTNHLLPVPSGGDRSEAPPPLPASYTPPRPNSASMDRSSAAPFGSPTKLSMLGSIRESYIEGRAQSVVSGMSLTLKEAVQQAGTAAAAKLHNDPLLKKAELSRTKQLPFLRAFSQKHKEGVSANDDSVAEVGVLRRKISSLPRKAFVEDIEAQRLLGHFPEQGDQSRLLSQPLAGKAIPAKPVGMRAIKSFSKSPSLSALPQAPRGDMSTLPPGSPAMPATAIMPSYQVEDREYDLWDYLIDCVVTISMSRPRNQNTEKLKMFTGMRRKPLSSKSLAALNPSVSPIPPPSVSQTPSKISKGHVPTPKAMRKTTGVASVNTVQSKMQQKQSVLDAKDKLTQLQKDQGTVYEEIYRRLVSVPVTSHEEISGERIATMSNLSTKSTVYISSLFKKFDKNLNGVISKDEFRLAMKELNIEVSIEDCDIFFNRFSSKIPGSIDWKEFLEFFETHIVGSTNKIATTDSSNFSEQGIVLILVQLKDTLHRVLLEMAASQINSIEKYLERKFTKAPSGEDFGADINHLTPRRQESIMNKFNFPENAIFHTLDAMHAKSNVALLQSLGLNNITVKDMERISRVFDNKVALFMEFIRAPSVDLQETLDLVDVEISKELSMRSGMSLVQRPSAAVMAASGTTMPAVNAWSQLLPSSAVSAPENATAASSVTTQSSATAKIWNSIAPDLQSTVVFEDFVKFLMTMLLNSAQKTPDEHSAKIKHLIGGVNIEVLTRIVTDTLVYSSWNRAVESSKLSVASKAKSSLLNLLSFSGLDAYMRSNRMNFIERKLKYLMQLESNISNPSVNLLLHAYVSTKGDELVILASDPLTSEVFKLHVQEDVKSLPYGDKLKALFMELQDWEAIARRVKGVFDPDSLFLYNPQDTPAEDKVISDIVSRLRVVRTRTNQSELIITEDPRFVGQLKMLLDTHANSLPFFYLVNGLNITFEVDEELLKPKAEQKDKATVSLRSFVFSYLRSQKALYTFLMQVRSSMKVVLSTYNSTSRETFSWEEMLAHLTNYRNPFMTVQLLPRYMPPEKFLYEPVESNKPFTGDDEDSEEEDEESLDPEGKKKKKRPNWQRSAVDYDGAPYPSWNTQFVFDFDAPKLTSCAVMCTEVVKMKMDEVWKYVMIIVRQGSRFKMTHNEVSKKEKEQFYFLTLYDPRSATEYQCGVKPGNPLYKRLYFHKDSAGTRITSFDVKEFLVILGEAADKQLLILGPAITPRLEIQVYNYKDEKTKELLGQCQVSISSVLSGSGVGDKAWAMLVHRQEKVTEGPAGSIVRVLDTNAGEVQLELSFRRSIEIEAAKQAEKEHLEKIRRGSVLKGLTEEDLLAGGVKGGDELLKEALKVALAKEKKGDKDKDSKVKTLETDYQTLLTEYRKLKAGAASGPEQVKAVADSTSTKPIDGDKLKSERDLAVMDADKAKKEKAAMEAELKRLNYELANMTVAAKDAKKELAPPATKSDDVNAKLLKELEELKKQNEALKASEKAAKEQVKELMSKQVAPATAPVATSAPVPAAAAVKSAPTVPSAASSSVAPVNGKKEETATQVKSAADPVIAPKASAEVKVGEPFENKSASANNLMQSGIAALDEDFVLSKTDFVEAVDQLVHCLLTKYIANNKNSISTNTQPAMVLEPFKVLLFSCANTEGLVSYKDLIKSCDELNIVMDTEIAVRLIQEIGPNLRKLVQVHSVMEFLSSEVAQILKGHGKKSKGVGKLAESSTIILPDEKYQATLRVILSRFQAKYEKSGRSLAQTTQPGVVFDGLQRMLVSYATENMVSAKEIMQAFSNKSIELEVDTAARMVYEVGMGIKKSVQVADLMDYLNKELVTMLREQRKTAEEPSAEVKKPAKTRPQSAAVAASTDAKLGSSVELSKDDSTRVPEGKPGKKVRASVEKEQAPAAAAPTAPVAAPPAVNGSRDWSKEALPPNWERRFHAA
ncbi:hypothetical protein EON65_02390, partial [archaeon]